MDIDAAEVTTVALLARREGMPVDLFSRYWRDVHGVLAVRIPGFWSYTQYHLAPCAPLPAAAGTFLADGLAEVCFRKAEDRAGLSDSAVIPLILRDEPNVFSRTLLYSLEAGASRTWLAPADESAAIAEYDEPAASHVLILRAAVGARAQDAAQDLDAMLARLRGSAELVALRSHLLSSGDPALWNTAPGVDNAESGPRNSAVIQAGWTTPQAAQIALEALSGGSEQVRSYRVTARCAMVRNGRPTQLGLRGLDALRTLEAAGAENQKEPELLRILFGSGIG